MENHSTLSIKQWAIEDRPREKLLQKGIFALSDAELLAILLSTGTKKLSAVELAKQVLSDANNNLRILGKKSINDLQKTKGIGQAKAISIIAALELGRRRKNAAFRNIKISSSETAFDIFQPLLGDLAHEEFWAIYLDRANQIIDKIRISAGGTVGTIIDNKIILKNGIEKLANGIILIHNHPSGNTKPSPNDIHITKKINEASKFVDIKILDHIIIGDTKYYSFNDNGIL